MFWEGVLASGLDNWKNMPRIKQKPKLDVVFRYSEKGSLRPGDTFRARGGPTYKGVRVGSPGLYKLLNVEGVVGGRLYLVAFPVDKYGLQVGGVCNLLVSGEPYRLGTLPDWIVRPYRVAKKRVKA